MVLDIEDTGVYPMYHEESKRLLLALEGSFRVMAVTPGGSKVMTPRIPVQIQPSALASHIKTKRVYVLNFLSNTLTILPTEELNITDAFLQQLANYRQDVILAFVSLFGGLLQYRGGVGFGTPTGEPVGVGSRR